MPRLRYFKNYDPPDITKISSTDNTEEFAEDYDDASTDGRQQPQKGWWSSVEIVKNLSTTKIKQTLENYRNAIGILEDELVSRRFCNRNPDSSFERYVVYEAGKVVRRCVQQNGADERRVLDVLKKQRINRTVRERIRKEWMEILDTYYEDKGA